MRDVRTILIPDTNPDPNPELGRALQGEIGE